MSIKRLLVLLSLSFALVPWVQAQIQHVDMRVEGMT
jgi:hypothetical protein